MLFALYRPESGEIYQVNKLYDDPVKYAEQLNGLGHSFVQENLPGLLPSERWFVDAKTVELCERPAMQATAYAPVIKAGDNALVTNIPKGASVDILAAGETIHSLAALDGDELQFPIPVACKYRIAIRKWPYQTCNIEIEAVAA